MPLSSRLANWLSPTKPTEGVGALQLCVALTALGRTRPARASLSVVALHLRGPGDRLRGSGLGTWPPGADMAMHNIAPGCFHACRGRLQGSWHLDGTFIFYAAAGAQGCWELVFGKKYL